MFSLRTGIRRGFFGPAWMLLIGTILVTGSLSAQQGYRMDVEQPSISLMAAVGYAYNGVGIGSGFSGIEKIGTPQLRAQVDYHVHRNFCVSAGMNSMGSTTFRGVDNLQGGTTRSGEVSALSAELSVSGHFELTSMSCLYARGGGAYLNVRQTVQSDGGSSTQHANGISPFTGIGVEVDCLNQVGFRLGMDWYFNAGDPSITGQGTIRSAYGGFVFRFR